MQCFTPVSSYLLPHLSMCVYITQVVVSDLRHTLLKSHRSKTGNHENNVSSLLSHQWLRCNSCTWAHDEQSCNGTSCAENMICHIVIVVAGRVSCFHDCINLVTRAILKNSLLSYYSEKMRWGRGVITTAQSVNLFM